MNLRDELHRAFSQFKAMLVEDQNDDLLDLPYAEYSLKCFTFYRTQLYGTILREGEPLSTAFCAIGIDVQLDQLVFFLHLLYLSQHMPENRMH